MPKFKTDTDILYRIMNKNISKFHWHLNQKFFFHADIFILIYNKECFFQRRFRIIKSISVKKTYLPYMEHDNNIIVI